MTTQQTSEAPEGVIVAAGVASRSLRVVIVAAAVSWLALAAGCGRTTGGRGPLTTGIDAETARDAPSDLNGDQARACFPLFHACTSSEECCAPRRCLSITGTPACQEEGPVLDAGMAIDSGAPSVCPFVAAELPRLVCFGADPDPYQRYLTPRDGGVAPGQCPTTADFIAVRGENCGYNACGPLRESALTALSDGSTIAAEAGSDCCFLLAFLCGV